MYSIADIKQYRETDTGTDLVIHIPEKAAYYFTEKKCRRAEIRLDDGRRITSDQRKKAYATIRDISLHTGYLPEEQKEWLKYLYIATTGEPYFSLSDCSVDTAREFISCIMEYALKEAIPLSEAGVMRTDDIGKYLWCCLKYKRCAVCGVSGEIHHVDAIGMGRDRKSIDDSDMRKICLCRKHHTAAHSMGMKRFETMYHVYGIKYNTPEGG